jgi:hypothetical protein
LSKAGEQTLRSFERGVSPLRAAKQRLRRAPARSLVPCTRPCCDEDATVSRANAGFSKSKTAKIIETVLHEEGRPHKASFDFVQGITSVARGRAHQDARLELESKAKRLMERAV